MKLNNTIANINDAYYNGKIKNNLQSKTRLRRFLGTSSKKRLK